DLPQRRAGRSLAGDPLVGRHVADGLRELPDPDRRQDGHRAEGPEHRPARPVVVRRLRRRRRGARGAAGLQGVLQGPARHLGRGDGSVIEAAGTRARGLRAHRGEATEVATALRRLDWWLVGATVALLAFGLWAIQGITAHDVTGNPDYFFTRQAIYATVGCIGAVLLLFVDPQVYRRHKNAIYAGTAGVMMLVLVAGTVSRHSKRWLY